MLDLFYGIGIFMQLFQLISFLLMGYGLYQINKKFGNEYPWLAFIPVINIYSVLQAAGKSLIWILYFILAFIAIFFGSLAALLIGSFGLIIPLIGAITLLILCIEIFGSISRNCGYGSFMTFGLILLPFIFFPYIGTKLPEGGVVSSSK